MNSSGQSGMHVLSYNYQKLWQDVHKEGLVWQVLH